MWENENPLTKKENQLNKIVKKLFKKYREKYIEKNIFHLCCHHEKKAGESDRDGKRPWWGYHYRPHHLISPKGSWVWPPLAINIQICLHKILFFFFFLFWNGQIWVILTIRQLRLVLGVRHFLCPSYGKIFSYFLYLFTL